MDKKSYKKWFLGLVCGDLYKLPLKNVLEVGETDEEQLELFENALSYSAERIAQPSRVLELLDRKVDTFTIEKYNKENKTNIPSIIDVIYSNDCKVNHTFLNNCNKLMHDESLLFIRTSQSLKSITDVTRKKGELQVVKLLKIVIDKDKYNLVVLSKNIDMIEQSEYRIENLLDYEKNE